MFKQVILANLMIQLHYHKISVINLVILVNELKNIGIEVDFPPLKLK